MVVARGGKGGMGVTRPTKEDNARLQTRKRRFLVSVTADLLSHLKCHFISSMCICFHQGL